MNASLKVQEYVQVHHGQDWHITSIYGYRFKDTGVWCWIVHLRRKNWIQAPGEKEMTVLVNQNSETFSERDVEMYRFNYRHLISDGIKSEG